MKIRLKPYHKYALRVNFPYLIIVVILFISTLVIPSFMLSKYFNNEKKIEQLEEELSQLDLKKSFLSSSLESSSLEGDVRIIKSLVPDFENYFSIIFALDELSKKSNFIISAYTVNLKDSNQERLSLSVQGIGDHASFLNFLEQYNFGGGRLITAEKIEFNNDNLSGTTLALNFYNKKVNNIADKNIDFKQTVERLAELREKVSYVIQPEQIENPSQDYPTKSNPF